MGQNCQLWLVTHWGVMSSRVVGYDLGPSTGPLAPNWSHFGNWNIPTRRLFLGCAELVTHSTSLGRPQNSLQKPRKATSNLLLSSCRELQPSFRPVSQRCYLVVFSSWLLHTPSQRYARAFWFLIRHSWEFESCRCQNWGIRKHQRGLDIPCELLEYGWRKTIGNICIICRRILCNIMGQVWTLYYLA